MNRNDAQIYDLHKEVVIGSQNLNYRMGNSTLSQLGLGTSQAQSLFPWAWSYWQGVGRSADSFVQLTVMTAAMLDGIWAGHAGSWDAPCQSRSKVIAPMGNWRINFPITAHFGQVHGHGSSQFYTNSGSGSAWEGSMGQGGTCFSVDHERWQGTEHDAVFQSGTWGSESLFGYHEAFVLKDIRIDGRKRSETFRSDRTKSGVRIWDMGSGAMIDRVFVENFEGANFHFARGTYINLGTVVSFRSNLAAVYLQGGGQMSISKIESDECPALIKSEEGFGRPPGIDLNVEWVKIETGSAPGRPVGVGTMVLDSAGWTNARFGRIQYSAVKSFPHCLFRVDTKGINSSFLSVGAVNLFGPAYGLMHDVQNKKFWKVNAPGGVNSNGYWKSRTKAFTWESEGGGVLTSGTVSHELVTGVGTGRLAVLNVNENTGAPIGSWNDQAWIPPYQFGPAAGQSGTTPPVPPVDPPVPPTPPVEPPVPPVEPPVEPEPPAPPTGLLYRVTFPGKDVRNLPGCKPIPANEGWRAGTIGANGITTTTNTNQAFNTPVKGVRRIRLMGVVFQEATQWRFLNDILRTGSPSKLTVDGKEVASFAPNAQPVDIDITLDTPRDVAMLFGGGPVIYNTLLLRMQGIELHG